MSGQNVEVLTGHLQNVSIKYKNAQLINTEIFPMLDMPSPTMKITKYERGQQFQSGARERAPGTDIQTTKVERTSITPTTLQYAASDQINREDLRDATGPGFLSPPINLVQDSIEKNAKDLDLGREIRVADHIFADTWTDGNAGGKDTAGSWLNASTSTFFADFDVAIKALKNEGVPANQLRLMLDFGTMQALKRIDDIREQLKYTSERSLTADSLARILQIDKVIVGSSIKNTAQAATTETFTGQCIWEKNATKGSAFLYNYERPTRKSLNAGVQPRSALDGRNFRITESYFDNKKKAWFYDSMEETDIITTASDAGYLWIDTILT